MATRAVAVTVVHMKHSRPSGGVIAPPSIDAVLPCHASAAGLARALVVDACRSGGVDQDATDSAELLVSEVVTNAVIHGRSEVSLRVSATSGLVRVEVGDDNSRRPARASFDPGALDGRGMTIVELMASRWGVEPGVVGKVVWFELAG